MAMENQTNTTKPRASLLKKPPRDVVEFFGRLASIDSIDDLSPAERIRLSEWYYRTSSVFRGRKLLPGQVEGFANDQTGLRRLHDEARPILYGLVAGKRVHVPLDQFYLDWELRNGKLVWDWQAQNARHAIFTDLFAALMQRFPYRFCEACGGLFVGVGRKRHCTACGRTRRKDQKRSFMREYMQKRRALFQKIVDIVKPSCTPPVHDENGWKAILESLRRETSDMKAKVPGNWTWHTVRNQYWKEKRKRHGETTHTRTG